MKKFFKILFAAVFMTALFVNVSISANKSAGDASLFSLISEADARCEARWYDGRVSATGANCFTGGTECDTFCY